MPKMTKRRDEVAESTPLPAYRFRVSHVGADKKLRPLVIVSMVPEGDAVLMEAHPTHSQTLQDFEERGAFVVEHLDVDGHVVRKWQVFYKEGQWTPPELRANRTAFALERLRLTGVSYASSTSSVIP